MATQWDESREPRQELHRLHEQVRLVPTGILGRIRHPAVGRHAQTLRADRVTKHVAADVLASLVVIGSSMPAHSRLPRLPTRIVAVGQHVAIFVDTAELSGTEAKLSA